MTTSPSETSSKYSAVSPFAIYNEFPKKSALITIVGVALIALALSCYFASSMWRGGVLPSFTARVALCSTMGGIGVIAIVSPLALGLFIRFVSSLNL